MSAPTPHGPLGPSVPDDQVAVFDDLRRRCPVAHHDPLGWLVLRHDDVSRVLQEHQTFSNAVSTRLTFPNGMDPPVHTASSISQTVRGARRPTGRPRAATSPRASGSWRTTSPRTPRCRSCCATTRP